MFRTFPRNLNRMDYYYTFKSFISQDKNTFPRKITKRGSFPFQNEC